MFSFRYLGRKRVILSLSELSAVLTAPHVQKHNVARTEQACSRAVMTVNNPSQSLLQCVFYRGM